MDPVVIAALMRELAMYYELDGDRHRTFAYERAAKAVGAANGLHRLLDEGRLEELPGVGPSIARTVGELARRGSTDALERMRAKWPPVVLELAQLPKIGVKKARALYEAFAPADLDAVAALCREHKVRTLKGFGAVSETAILDAIADHRDKGIRVLLMDAIVHAEGIAAQLRHAGLRVTIGGPVRRWIEEVDHLAFAVEEAPGIEDRLAGIQAIARTEHGFAGRLANGLRVDFVIAPRERFGWAEIVATGSPEHVAALAARAGSDRVDGPDEATVYGKLGLAVVPPECRDGTDELADTFDDLITLADLTTITHCHTTYSDGKHTIAQMAKAAGDRGFRGITITDHSAAASYAGGLDLARLREQAAEIRSVDSPVRILHGTEADILADGTIDVPPEMIPELDLVIASVHQRYSQDPDATTQRLVAAMRQPFFKIWGHALGRLVLRRKPIDVRIDEVFDAIAESPAAIEINGDPHRLDLPPELARRAAQRGIKFVLSTDAHSTGNLEFIHNAVALARRARLRRRDVLNALPPDELAAAIRPLPAAAPR